MKLTKKQLEQLLEEPRLDQKGTNLYAVCPKCKHDEFGISLENNHAFSCFRKSKCGWVGNIYTLLKFLGKAKEFLSEYEIDIFEKLESGFFAEPIPLDLELPEIQVPILWKRCIEDVYLRERGFVDYQFEKFEVGRSKLTKEYVTFLVRMNGKLVGHVTRSERKKSWIDAFNEKQASIGSKLVYLRYKNSTTDFTRALFGYDEIVPGVTTDVIMVEGIFSKTKTDLNLNLDYFDEMKCVATFGAKLSPHQIQLLKLKGIKNLWFWFEADVLEKVKDIVADAALHFNVRVSYLNGKDPNDIDADGALALLEAGKDWFQFNTSYIRSNLKV
jgi:hypothetical protein